MAGSIGGVIAFRAAQGVCAALLIPNTLGLLRAVFPPRRFGMAVGLWAMVASCSTALGPIVSGLLVEHVSWESVFLINLPIGVAAVVFSALAAGLVVLALFCWYETRQAHPLLPMRLFRSPALTIGAIVTAINFFVLLGIVFFLMLYLQNVRGFTPVEAGVRTLPLSLATVIASPLGAAVTGRFGARVAMPTGMALQAAASWMLTWDAHSPYTALWPPFLALGLGVGMVMSASSDAIVGNAPAADGGVAGGLQATALQVGGALGTSVLVSLIGARVGATLTGELTGAGVPAGVPAGVAAGLAHARDAVAMGVSPVSAGMNAQVAAAVAEGSGNAFMTGVHAAVLLTGVLCVAGGVLAAAGLRHAGRRES